MSITKQLWPKIPDKIKPFCRSVYDMCMWTYGAMYRLPGVRVWKVIKSRKLKPLRLNIGCGKVKLPGWVNIDIRPGADLVVDIRKALPFKQSTVDLIYCEHVLEHLAYNEGQRLLKEFQRCLKQTGIVRIAMPDLDYIIEKYNTDWKDQDWLTWPEYASVATKGQMINMCFRSWGHKYLYNEEDLRNELIGAGFPKTKHCTINESDHDTLRDLETRADSRLVMEAQKA
jgi:predicted SAM-dependent methyltransferase